MWFCHSLADKTFTCRGFFSLTGVRDIVVKVKARPVRFIWGLRVSTLPNLHSQSTNKPAGSVSAFTWFCKAVM